MDLIDRQAAIDALWKALYKYEDKTEKQFQDSDELDADDWFVHRIFVQNMSDIDRQTILELPSAQPETCVDAVSRMKTEKIVQYVEDSLNNIYCNTCKNSGNYDVCDYCHRKSMMWGISREAAESIVNGIVKILKEGEKNKYSQIDCPMDQTECDENCVYYNKLLLRCPMKVKGNGGKQDE